MYIKNILKKNEKKNKKVIERDKVDQKRNNWNVNSNQQKPLRKRKGR